MAPAGAPDPPGPYLSRRKSAKQAKLKEQQQLQRPEPSENLQIAQQQHTHLQHERAAPLQSQEETHHQQQEHARHPQTQDPRQDTKNYTPNGNSAGSAASPDMHGPQISPGFSGTDGPVPMEPAASSHRETSPSQPSPLQQGGLPFYPSAADWSTWRPLTWFVPGIVTQLTAVTNTQESFILCLLLSIAAGVGFGGGVAKEAALQLAPGSLCGPPAEQDLSCSFALSIVSSQHLTSWVYEFGRPSPSPCQSYLSEAFDC